MAAEQAARPKRRLLRRRNQFVSFLVSGAVHGVVLCLGGWVLLQPARYGMEIGSGGLELYLVAAPPQGLSVPRSSTAFNPPPVESSENEFSLPEPLPATGSESSGQDSTTFYSPGGGQTDAEPGAFKNPAPPYPEAARRLGQEGTVVLRIALNQEGHPTRVEIRRSSGYPLLDESALTTIRRWEFTSARWAGRPVDSEEHLKIHFKLEEDAQ